MNPAASKLRGKGRCNGEGRESGPEISIPVESRRDKKRERERERSRGDSNFAEAERHKVSAGNLISGARQRPPLPPFEGQLLGHGYSPFS